MQDEVIYERGTIQVLNYNYQISRHPYAKLKNMCTGERQDGFDYELNLRSNGQLFQASSTQ